MAAQKPTIALITTHAVLRSVYERHGEHFAKMVSLPDVAEFERRAVRLRASIVMLDETGSEALADIARLRKRFSASSLRIVVLSPKLTHDRLHELRAAGADDILLTTHHTPRDIMSRLQELLAL